MDEELATIKQQFEALIDQHEEKARKWDDVVEEKQGDANGPLFSTGWSVMGTGFKIGRVLQWYWQEEYRCGGFSARSVPCHDASLSWGVWGYSERHDPEERP
jgi:hypothetical protein